MILIPGLAHLSYLHLTKHFAIGRLAEHDGIDKESNSICETSSGKYECAMSAVSGFVLEAEFIAMR
jgi:hypothetical protein